MKCNFYFQQSYVRHESGIWFVLQSAPFGEMSKCLFCCCAVCIISVFGRWARPGRTTDAVGWNRCWRNRWIRRVGERARGGGLQSKAARGMNWNSGLQYQQGCINCSGYKAQSILMHYFSNPFLLFFNSMCHLHGQLERLRKRTHF